MKTLVSAILITLLICSTAFAAAYSTVGFRAYTSATPATCMTFTGLQAADGTFTVDSMSALNLGTKGVVSITPVWNRDLKVVCYATATGAAYTAKMFFDTESANAFPMSTFLLRVR